MKREPRHICALALGTGLLEKRRLQIDQIHVIRHKRSDAAAYCDDCYTSEPLNPHTPTKLPRTSYTGSPLSENTLLIGDSLNKGGGAAVYG